VVVLRWDLRGPSAAKPPGLRSAEVGSQLFELPRLRPFPPRLPLPPLPLLPRLPLLDRLEELRPEELLARLAELRDEERLEPLEPREVACRLPLELLRGILKPSSIV
jgi:hypothetical protein